jgi:hypothetical protein
LISPAAAGNVNDGDHRIKVTLVTTNGETEGGTASSNVTVADKTTNGKIVWSSIPTSANAAVTSRKLYRQFNSAGDYKLLTTLSDNSTTSYTDNVANASLTTIMPTGNTTGKLKMAGPVELKKGTDVASANDLILPGDGNLFDVTGTTTINGIRTAGWQSGTLVILQFDGILTLKHNTAPSSGFAKIQLRGAADLTTGAGVHVVLYYDGTDWEEYNGHI